MPKDSIRIIPLGGLGEIGQNMMAIEFRSAIVVIDAGVLFPRESMPGIDFAIPDTSYLRENQHKIKAILITHGHEDHIGALPYVLQEIVVPVYSSRLTHGLITVKLREHKLLADARLNVVEPQSPFNIGPFEVEFFRVCHSIPDAMGISIKTSLGTIIHTGDFKIDHTPADGKKTDFSHLARLAGDGVFLLFSDSTYSEVEGYTLSEQVVGDALDRVIGEAPGRVMVATFASLISRIQQVVDAAARHNRKVTVVGRSMSNNVKMASSMGYLNIPPATLIPMHEAQGLPNEELVVLATGAQGEPTSALVRIANGEHQDIVVVPGDTVVISASPIPGNEPLVSDTIDKLFRQDAKVLYSRIATVHVHGHGSREELKMMLDLVKPKFFVPVHGEFRHLVAHAELAQDSGIPSNNIFVLEDGDVLELRKNHGAVVDTVPAGHVFVDGKQRWDMRSNVLAERLRLAKKGIVSVFVSTDKDTGALLKCPTFSAFGFGDIEESEMLLEKASQKVVTRLEHVSQDELRLGKLKGIVQNEVSKVIRDETRTNPIVLVCVEKL